MWDQPVYSVVSPLPPVLRGSQVEQQRRPLLKGKFSRTSAHVVKFRYGLDLLQFCIVGMKERILQNFTEFFCGSVRQPALGYWPSSLVLGPLSTSSRAPGSLWGLSLNGGTWRQKRLEGNNITTESNRHFCRSFDILTSTPPHQPCTFHTRGLLTRAEWEISTRGG